MAIAYKPYGETEQKRKEYFMKQITLDFSDQTDKVLLDTQGNQISLYDLLSAIRCLSTVSLKLVDKHNGSVSHTLALINHAVCEGYSRFENNDVIEHPSDLSPWRDEDE